MRSCEKTLLGSDDLLVIELVVGGHGFLILDPLFTLALVELGSGVKDDLLELLELGEDLRLDLVVVVLSLVSVELLGKVGDGSPEIVPLLLELEGNDFPGAGGSNLDFLLVYSSFHLYTFPNVFNTVTEGRGSHRK